MQRLRSLLLAERAAQEGALARVLDSKAAERMSARIVDRVRRDEDRRVELGGRRRFWARFLAISVAAHVVVLGVLSWQRLHGEGTASPREDRAAGDVAFAPLPSDPADPDAMASRDPREEPTGGFRLDPDAPLPVEALLEPDPAVARAPVDPLLPARPLGMTRAFWVRTSDPMKRLIEERVGAKGTLDRVKAALTGLARVQLADGAFPGPDGVGTVRATATVVLAFLGDGHSSEAGTHREVVARGTEFLWARADDPATSADDRALALLALAEDVLLTTARGAGSAMRSRGPLLGPVARAVALERARRADEVGTGRAPARGLDARWADLALAAAARTGAIPTTAAVAIAPGIDPATIVPGADVRTAMLDGTVLLRDRQGAAFTAWNSATARTLGARLATDGTVAAAKAEETALILLALQVAYRTY